MTIIVPIYAVHHDPQIYENPEEFRPERFMSDELKNRPSVAFMPFGAGPRNCIASRLGMVQVRCSLIMLLKEFTFSTCEETVPMPIKLHPWKIVLASERQILLKVRKNWFVHRTPLVFWELFAFFKNLMDSVLNQYSYPSLPLKIKNETICNLIRNTIWALIILHRIHEWWFPFGWSYFTEQCDEIPLCVTAVYAAEFNVLSVFTRCMMQYTKYVWKGKLQILNSGRWKRRQLL